MALNRNDSAGMADITAYAPGRIALAAFGRMLAGAVVLGIAALFAVMTARMPELPKSAADPPPWLGAAIGAVFALVGTVIFTGGVGRLRCAFARDCHVRAGAAGIALRFPVLGWFGRYRLREARLAWTDIRDLVDFTYRINGIATAHELRIKTSRGETIRIPRYYFSDSAAVVQERLLAILRGAAGRGR